MADTVTILFFAQAREAVGRGRIVQPVDSSTRSVAAILRELTRLYPNLEAVLSHSRVVVNGTYVSRGNARIQPGDEIAIHPPYSGG